MKNMVDIQVVFKGSIKPSVPTPDHLRHYQLSFLDQIKGSYFMPMIVFYSQEAQTNIPTKEQRSDIIKKSLSKALTHFYPLAGRVKSKLYVDCNDEGAYYVEAEAKCQLSDILQNPNPNDMNDFLPLELCDTKGLSLMVQVTFFDCGGMAIGVGLHHQIAGGLSFVMFLNGWSALGRGQTDFKAPIFGGSKLFTPQDMSTFPRDYRNVEDKKNVSKRFVFDASKIETLVNKYSDDDGRVRRPTRFEAISAFIWNRFVVATRRKETEGKIYKFTTPVDIRRKMEPKLPDNYFGNFHAHTVARLPSFETNYKDGGYINIVSTIKDAKKQMDPEAVKKLQRQSDWYLDFLKEQFTQIDKGEMSFFLFTSLCWFPIYEIDFGWGKPAFVGLTRLTCRNKVAFLDTKYGDGIEAWVNLEEDDMAKFEADEEILAMFPQLPKNNLLEHNKSFSISCELPLSSKL